MNPLMTTGMDPERSGATALGEPQSRRDDAQPAPLGIPSVTRAATQVLKPARRHHRASASRRAPHPPGRRGRPRRAAEGLAAGGYNIEGNPLHNLMDHVRAQRHRLCTFVPDAQGQSTSDHGWDLGRDGHLLAPLIDEAHALGVGSACSWTPEPAAMAPWRARSAPTASELYTEPYAAAHGSADQAQELVRFAAAAQPPLDAGLGVNAGHDLNRANLADFLRAVPGVLEVSIGHALVSDALGARLRRHGAPTTCLRCIAAADGPAR